MAYLILKDLLLQKRMLLLAFVYVLMFTFAFQGMGEGQLIAIITAVGYMFVMMGGAWEEKNNADVLWSSLPTPKWKTVGAKYLSIPVYVAIVIVIYWVMHTLFSVLRVPVRSMPLDLVGAVLGMTAVFVAAILFMAAIEIRHFGIASASANIARAIVLGSGFGSFLATASAVLIKLIQSG